MNLSTISNVDKTDSNMNISNVQDMFDIDLGEGNKENKKNVLSESQEKIINDVISD